MEYKFNYTVETKVIIINHVQTNSNYPHLGAVKDSRKNIPVIWRPLIELTTLVVIVVVVVFKNTATNINLW